MSFNELAEFAIRKSDLLYYINKGRENYLNFLATSNEYSLIFQAKSCGFLINVCAIIFVKYIKRLQNTFGLLIAIYSALTLIAVIARAFLVGYVYLMLVDRSSNNFLCEWI